MRCKKAHKKRVSSECLPYITLSLFCLFSVGGVRADSLDTLNLYVGETLTYDNNLFRLPDLVDARSDKIAATTLGLKINKPYSLQRFELDVNLVDYRYQTYDYLDFVGKNYSAAWRWSLTPSLHGNLTTNRRESLNSFTDYRNFRTQNLRIDEDSRLDADYDLGAGWHVVGGVFQLVRTNSEPFVQEGDNTLTSTEAGVRYQFTSGTTLSFLNRIGRGVFDNRPEPIPSALLDNRFDQNENLISIKWPLTEKTSMDARLGWLDRQYDNYSERDYSGVVGALNLNWGITDKTRISGGIGRELSSYQSLTSSYTVTDRFNLTPVWQMSAKTALRLRYDYSSVDYLGSLVSNPLGDRVDRIQTGLIAVDWQPLNSVSVSASIVNDSRSSSQSLNDYKDTTASINAQINF